MTTICEKDKCTACFACVNACPRQCITMKEDETGCLHPHVDESKCIDCKLCQKSCPNNAQLDFKYPSKCYASWITDVAKRKICASGGIGTTMSEYVLQQGGVVFGSRYNSNLTPIMTYTESIDELQHFKGSRYVQSIVGEETFKQVRNFLKVDRLVLFIGTPCQIAGLKTFLRKDYASLITVDLICHGVCPTSYFKAEVKHLTTKYNLKNVSDIRFRGNDGNNYFLSLWNNYKKKLFPKDNYFERILHINTLQQYYIQGFLLGVSMRENCYTCNYARPERISDITIGDFIGLGSLEPFNHSKANVSSVMINTSHGAEFYNSLSEFDSNLINVERKYEERLIYKPSLVEPFKRHPLNEKFKNEYKQHGYVIGIRNTLQSILLKKQFILYLNYWTYIYRIPRKLVNVVFKKNKQ